MKLLAPQEPLSLGVAINLAGALCFFLLAARWQLAKQRKALQEDLRVSRWTEERLNQMVAELHYELDGPAGIDVDGMLDLRCGGGGA